MFVSVEGDVSWRKSGGLGVPGREAMSLFQAGWQSWVDCLALHFPVFQQHLTKCICNVQLWGFHMLIPVC